MSSFDPDPINRLTEINLQDVLSALGWEKARLGRPVLAWPFRAAARRFACQVLEYDRSVARHGLQTGASHFLKTLLKDLIIEGQEQIPAGGPILFLSNHPGLTDTVSLFASIPRPDLQIVAADRPFLRALPATGSHLIYVSEDSNMRMSVLRQISGHLRAGGAVLTFPAGRIEPDPALLPGAEETLDQWSPSIGLFARMAPDTLIIPVIVSGVLAPRATFHLLTHLRRNRPDRERLGATLQILASVVWPSLWRDLWNVTVHVRFAPAIQARELVPLRDPEIITREVTRRTRPFLHHIVESEAYSSTT